MPTLDDLERLAQAATPGPWEAVPVMVDEYTEDQVAVMGPPATAPDAVRGNVISTVYYDGHHLVVTPADRKYIAACPPSNHPCPRPRGEGGEGA
jgi:hypothetical protein